jgi:protocatechuate 3,4-dioxygenase beta subunit
MKSFVLFILSAFAAPLLGFAQTPQSTASEHAFARARTSQGFAICGSCSVPDNISSKATLAPSSESGERVVISGTIYQSDGVTPASGITLFLYQTDAGGYYRRPKEDVFAPRLHGWLRTGSDGRYEISTIRPAPEVLARDEPGHIHAHVFGRGIPEHFLHEFWFTGDPRVRPEEAKELGRLGRFSPLVHLERKESGAFVGVRDIRLKPTGAWQYEGF